MDESQSDLTPVRSWDELIATSKRRGTFLRRRRRVLTVTPALLVLAAVAAIPTGFTGGDRDDVLDVATEPSEPPRAIDRDTPHQQVLTPAPAPQVVRGGQPREDAPAPDPRGPAAEVVPSEVPRRPPNPDAGTTLRRIVFSRGTQYQPNQRNFELMTAWEDGSGEQQLTTSQTDDEYDPTWSPEGRRIAFAKDEWSGVYGDQAVGGIFVMSADGSATRRLTRVHCPTLTGPCFDEAPAWSPDGRQVAFQRYGGETGDRGCAADTSCSAIWVMNADGSAAREVTSGWEADWSPDGRRLVFADTSAPGAASSCATVPGAPERCQSYLYISNADGSGRRALGVAGDAPRWSPDGTRIVFEPRDSAQAGIAVLEVATGDLRALTRTRGDQEPAWSPDGRDVVFVSQGDVFVIGVDGRNLAQVTDSPAAEESPRFAPDP